MPPESNISEILAPLPSLQNRVRRKREVLQRWLDKGIPHDKLPTLPTSLTEAREWQDAELGLHRIGSPNSFTTGHPDFGEDVKAINTLLEKLRNKVKRPGKKRPSSQQPVISSKDVERALAALTSQWHMAREDARIQRERANLAHKHLEHAREDLRKANAELAALRRRVDGGLKLI